MEKMEKLKKKTKKLRIIEIILFIIIAFILIFFEQICNLYNDKGKCYETSETYAIESFNAKFWMYVGEGVDYNTAKQCISNIYSNNENNDRKINCNTTVGNLDRQKKYTIDCEVDSDGYIYYITITKEGE